MKLFKFRKAGKGIFIVLLSLLSTVSFAQQSTVNGKVTDSNGGGLPGVTIVEKGTTNGTITNLDGVYQITVSGADAVLQISFIGMK
ncbi:MAG: carboxypeptidase-like regulatory domain-containing protein [Draconibacterium sp.]